MLAIEWKLEFVPYEISKFSSTFRSIVNQNAFMANLGFFTIFIFF